MSQHRAVERGWERVLHLESAFRRLFISVTSSHLFDLTSGRIFLSVELGSSRAESEPQPLDAASGMLQWEWRADLEPSESCTHATITVSRKRLLGNEVLGECNMPLSSLRDQHAHELTLSLAPSLALALTLVCLLALSPSLS